MKAPVVVDDAFLPLRRIVRRRRERAGRRALAPTCARHIQRHVVAPRQGDARTSLPSLRRTPGAMPWATGEAASGRSACLGSLWIELALSCRSHERGQALGFLRRGSSSRSCQREVLASRVDIARSFDRDNQPFVGETTQHLVERTSRGIEASAGLILDVLSDRVSVRRSLPKGEEDVKHEVGQCRSRVDFLHGSIGRRSPSEGWLTANYSSGHYSGRSETGRFRACLRLAGISAA